MSANDISARHDAGMVRLFMLLFLLALALTALALISCLSAEADEVRALPRPLWVIVILFLPVVGALIYFSTGRPLPDDAAGSGPGGAGGSGAGARIWRTAAGAISRPQRSVAPDDDPDFLKTIDGRTRAADDELLRQWEEEFRNREDDPRKEPYKRDKSIDDSPPSDG
jgi:Phospholipase_D-nuclease N-terminal